MRTRAAGAGFVAIVLLAGACASSDARSRGSADVLRLGVFATLTHAPAHIAVGAGIFERVLAPTRVEVTVFESGSDAGIALLSGSIDATYIGPWPTASLYLRSGAVAVVSGVTSGGTSFVVRTGAGIAEPADLHGRRIAVPGVGNTQDIALRAWLRGNGLRAREEGGDVSVVGIGGPELIPLFERDQLDGAWMPEPYPSYLIARGVAERFVDEGSLWPGGEFVTAELVVSTIYLEAHPENVRALVEANVEAVELANAEPERAKELAREQLESLGVPDLGDDVLDAAWAELTFTWDPVAPSFQQVAEDAFEVGLLDERPGDLSGIYRLDDLDDVLNDEGLPPVEVGA
jgi:NitT/TauT family transport system substrate-binding protein